jgi:hypothetical protein
MLSTTLRATLIFTLAAAAAACGGEAPTPATPAAPVDSSGAAASAASAAPATPADTSAPAAGADAVAVPAAWSASLSHPQAAAFMKAKVVGPMGKAFKDHDATKYGDFGCKTCHGKGQNPHDFLPHLTFSGGTITQFKDKPEISKWMHEVVEPQMAGAMGAQPYDMKTNTGFGCKGCHTVDMK